MHRRLATAAALAACLGGAEAARAAAYDQQSPGMRALYTGVAVVANVTPFVATLYAPRCLPGYVVCKLTYAGLSLAAAADQLVLSGGGDLARSEEHTSELQSHSDLVCRLLLEKKKTKKH